MPKRMLFALCMGILPSAMYFGALCHVLWRFACTKSGKLLVEIGRFTGVVEEYHPSFFMGGMGNHLAKCRVLSVK